MIKSFYLILFISSISLSFAGPAELRKARQITTRLTGAPFPSSDSRVSQMETMIANGQLIQAATLATNDPGFVNNILRLFAAPFQSKNQSYREVKGSESSLYIMGIIRDERPITDILDGQDFYYNPSIACNYNSSGYKGIPGGVRTYDRYACSTEIDYTSGGPDLNSSASLVSRPDRLVPIYNNVTGTGREYGSQIFTEIPSEDLAGIFTMRGFGTAAGFAGTNRAYVQMMVNQLWCKPVDAIRSSSADPTYIGRDVSRNPDGTGLTGTYSTQCKTCHAPIDGLRGAFAYLDANIPLDYDLGNTIHYKSATGGVLSKYSRNSSTFPTGHVTSNNSWVATFTPAQLTEFGWTGPTQGTGVRSLAQAFGQSQQFYRCMVQKVSELVCPSDPSAVMSGGAQALSPTVREDLATELKGHQNLKRTFREIAVRPECLGG